MRTLIFKIAGPRTLIFKIAGPRFMLITEPIITFDSGTRSARHMLMWRTQSNRIRAYRPESSYYHPLLKNCTPPCAYRTLTTGTLTQIWLTLIPRYKCIRPVSKRPGLAAHCLYEAAYFCRISLGKFDLLLLLSVRPSFRPSVPIQVFLVKVFLC